jgi:predicted ferric reductase
MAASAVAPARSAPGPERLSRGEVLALISAGAVLAGGWPLLVALRGPQSWQGVVVVAHVGGMLAGYGVLVMLALMSRAPALESGVGADVLARWHARGGRIVLSLVLVHAWAAVAAWARSRGESMTLALWHVLRLPWLTAATVGTVLLVAAAAASIRMARRKLSYERWHALHLTTYVAVSLAFVHELAGPDLTGHRWLQIAWALLYTQVFALLLRHRFLTPLRGATRHRLRVTAVIAEGPDVVSIEIAGHHLEELNAEPGQFLRWRFLTPDTWLTAHPFSLSAPATPDRLRLTVKALGEGSRRLQQLEVGTWVVAEGPYGALTAAARTRRDVLLIAGGVGITPMRALFETLPLAPGQQLTLIYRARTPDDVLFKSELDEIAARRGTPAYLLVGDAGGWLSAEGLLRLVPGLAERDVFMCGSSRLTDAVRRALRSAGVPTSSIHEERFEF